MENDSKSSWEKGLINLFNYEKFLKFFRDFFQFFRNFSIKYSSPHFSGLHNHIMHGKDMEKSGNLNKRSLGGKGSREDEEDTGN